mmetsp:Transcript_13876/g.20955  ORF Transcript_13876/g.20955 Transcript_13876/m.20955 type:complete len:350 (+) Transcript_13876:40-1089(+)
MSLVQNGGQNRRRIPKKRMRDVENEEFLTPEIEFKGGGKRLRTDESEIHGWMHSERKALNNSVPNAFNNAKPIEDDHLLDTYPVHEKLHCPYKARSNDMLAELSRGIINKNCLILDAASCLTSRRLVKAGISPSQIHVPNKCMDAYDALRDSGVCKAHFCSVSEFLRNHNRIGEFGIVYLDYCTTLDGGSTRYETTPRYDIQDLFYRRVLSASGCILAVTLCKPRDDLDNQPQFMKLRHHITMMGLKYGYSVIIHEENNSYDNWITEFYVLGNAASLRQFYQVSSLSGTRNAQISSSIPRSLSADYERPIKEIVGSQGVIDLSYNSDEEKKESKEISAATEEEGVIDLT